jgi:hypothetical protein
VRALCLAVALLGLSLPASASEEPRLRPASAQGTAFHDGVLRTLEREIESLPYFRKELSAQLSAILDDPEAGSFEGPRNRLAELHRSLQPLISDSSEGKDLAWEAIGTAELLIGLSYWAEEDDLIDLQSRAVLYRFLERHAAHALAPLARALIAEKLAQRMRQFRRDFAGHGRAAAELELLLAGLKGTPYFEQVAGYFLFAAYHAARHHIEVAAFYAGRRGASGSRVGEACLDRLREASSGAGSAMVREGGPLRSLFCAILRRVGRRHWVGKPVPPPALYLELSAGCGP